MNLSKLFEMQAKLDAYIERKHPRKENEDRLVKKILALQVELGELANEWRGFKFWSNDQEPRIVEYRDCPYCGGHGVIDCFPFGAPDETHAYEEQCPECVGGQVEYNPLLEEYVDCLHFLLSIGLENEVGTFTGEELMTIKMGTIEMQFITLFKVTVTFLEDISYYQEMWELFVGLGEMLGFTWDEIEQAYYAKNKVNHERQEEGY